MKPTTLSRPHFKLKAGVFSLLQLALIQTYAAVIPLAQSPLFLSTTAKVNVLMLYGNSNSMDSDPTGRAVGSDVATSKSEISRGAIKSLVDKYTGVINMGLIAYQQDNHSTPWILHDSQYDASYNVADYDASFNGVRYSATKKFKVTTKSGTTLYYNVNLPFYDPSPQGDKFCYAKTACTDPTHNFSCSAPIPADHTTYQCYPSKTTNSNAAPSTTGSGYSGAASGGNFTPTDSDIGQGLSDFGKRLAYQQLGKAWFVNTAPGMGYLHVPIADLSGAQVTKMNDKMKTSQFTSYKPTDITYPLQNAGLSALEGTVLTANNYFNGKSFPSNQGGSGLPALPNSCGKNFLVALTDGLPSVTQNGVKTTDDTVAALAGLQKEVADLKASTAGAETYVVGFALPFGVSATQLDDIAGAGGTTSAYKADDTVTLTAAFNKIFNDIIGKTSAASAVALSSQSITKGGRVFQGLFNSTDWSGQLLNFGLIDGVPSATYSWDAGAVLKTMTATGRVVITSKPSVTPAKGIAFRWPVTPSLPGTTELDPAQMLALSTSGLGVVDGKGSERLNYLRGDATNADGVKFRKRSAASGLGDIINSSPHYVAAPSFNYGLPDYAAFRTKWIDRTKMIYVGANDGMLHGFDAATGIEKLAFVPSSLFSSLSALTEPTYAHRYYVDGSPVAGDVYYNSAWHTVLVGSMGTGARGIFALDVTDPGAFTEANAAKLVNFEFTSKEDSDVGYIAGPVSISRMNNGRWAAIFGNGYNSTGTGTSTLFVVDVETGALIRKISTLAGVSGTPNALARPLAIDTDGDLTTDVVYAGDLLGNMWKFDLSSADPADWSVAYKLFQASQPITTAPDVGEHPNGGFMVFFGTGKYLETSDVASAPGNSFYGIWDKGVPVTTGLVTQTLVTIPDITDSKGVTYSYRSATKNTIDWAVNTGWSIALPNNPERVVADPILRGGRVIFTSIIPSGALCTAGGTSWLNEVDWLTGGLLDAPPFDTTGDDLVNTSDTIAASKANKNGIMSGAAIQNIGELDAKLFNDSSGKITRVVESKNALTARRLSWREIK